MADCLWTETPLGMAAAGSGLGRTLDDHEEIRINNIADASLY